MKKLTKVLGSLFLVSSLGLVACNQATTPTRDEGQVLTPSFTVEDIQNWNEKYENSTRIFTIQGDKHESNMKDQTVENVPGVVTAIKDSGKYQNINEFTIQDISGDGNIKTSDAIQVFLSFGKGNPLPGLEEIKIGDIVTVTGIVNEYAYKAYGQQKSEQLSTTQIKVTKKEDLKIIRPKEVKLPTPILIKYSDLNKKVFAEGTDLLNDSLNRTNEAIDYFESLESMRVCVKNPSVVALANKAKDYIIPGDYTVKLSENGGVILNGYNQNHFISINASYAFGNREKAGLDVGYGLKGGDKFTGDIIGVIGYDHSSFEIRMTEKFPKLTKNILKDGKEKIKPFAEDKLNIVSYNLENFSKTSVKDPNYDNFAGSPSRAPLFAKQFVEDFHSPDVICLIEVQDDDCVKGVNQVLGPNKKPIKENGYNKLVNTSNVVSAKETLNLLISEIDKLNGPKYAQVNIDPTNGLDGGQPGGNIRCCYLYRTDRIALVADSDNNFENSTSTTEAKFEGGKLEQNPARLGTVGDAFENTRKSLVAHFKFIAGPNKDKDFILINNHLKSKRGDAPTWGCEQPASRGSETKRHEQAQIISNFIKTTGNTPVISVGDYNDFHFSKTVKDIIQTPNKMLNVVESLPENERYTYSYDGYSQSLDQILVKGLTIPEKGVYHCNYVKPSHYPNEAESGTKWPEQYQLSDHDPVWAQLAF